MTLSTMDTTPALVVVDLQKGIVGLPGEGADAIKPVIANAAELAGAFRAHGLPVVLVSILGDAPGRTEVAPPTEFTPAPDWAHPVDDLEPAPGDLRVVRQRWSAFGGTSLHEDLRRAGVTQVVVAGVATSVGVESTARAAHEHGYHVTLATDAMSDLDAETHRHSVERIFPRLGERGTTAEILELLTKTHD